MVDFNPNESFELAPYNAEWPELFTRESALIANAIGEAVIEIEHIGSTSVPGLAAKPIIDIMLVVESFAPVEEYRRRLEPLG